MEATKQELIMLTALAEEERMRCPGCGFHMGRLDPDGEIKRWRCVIAECGYHNKPIRTWEEKGEIKWELEEKSAASLNAG